MFKETYYAGTSMNESIEYRHFWGFDLKLISKNNQNTVTLQKLSDRLSLNYILVTNPLYAYYKSLIIQFLVTWRQKEFLLSNINQRSINNGSKWKGKGKIIVI